MRRRRMYLTMVTRSVTRRRSRVLIALLAVAIGSTTVCGLATIAIDLPRQMSMELRAYGANLLVLPAGDDAVVSPRALPEITALVPGTELVGAAPYRYETMRINSQPYLAAGTDLDEVRTVSPYWDVDGQWPAAPGEVLVGQDVAARIGLEPGSPVTLVAVDAAGEDVSLRAMTTGVLATGGEEDGIVFLDLADLAELTGIADRIDVVELSVAADGSRVAALAGTITEQVDEVVAGPVTRLTESDTAVLGTLRSLLALVTVVVLALTMTGVATTTMAVVTERRTEIGLRKALGADDRSVVGEFLGEAVLVGALGGAIGAALGFGMAQVVSVNVFHRTMDFQPLLALAAVAVSVLAAGAASLLPVRRATEIDPAVVLRGE